MPSRANARPNNKLSCIGCGVTTTGAPQSFFPMTPQQRIDWINYVDEISHRLHELMAIHGTLKDQELAYNLDINLAEMDDALQATKELLPPRE
jgi:hypothetical protein